LRSPWSLIVAVNDDRVLHSSLLASPALGDNCQIILRRGYTSAGQAYNSGLAEARHDLVVLAHQDVYLPAEWPAALAAALAHLEETDPAWGVLGPFGVSSSTPAEYRGFCYSTGIGMLGEPFSLPIPAFSLDELLLVVRRSSGLRFDEDLPGFHLYGTDICLQAQRFGMASYIVPAFCIHNANGIRRLPRPFWDAWFYLRKKWWSRLPVVTCCTEITRGCYPVARRLAQETKERVFPRTVGTRRDNMRQLYAHLLHTYPGIAAQHAATELPQ
jgi:hypothetical protein